MLLERRDCDAGRLAATESGFELLCLFGFSSGRLHGRAVLVEITEEGVEAAGDRVEVTGGCCRLKEVG